MNDADNKSFAVSVIIPAYNAGKYISRAIESVLAQTYSAEEVIVVDDGSTDNTAEIVKKYGPPVKYVYQENSGVSSARNKGVATASGEWIAFLDADDEWLPEHLALQVQMLRNNPDLKWVTGNYDLCLCGQNRRGPHIPIAKAEKLLGSKDYFEDYYHAYTNGSGGCTITMLIKKELIEEAGMFRLDLYHGEDIDLWLSISHQHQRIGYISKPISIYHLGVIGSSSQHHRPVFVYSNLIKRHLELSKEAGRRKEFEKIAAILLSRWIRSMLFYSERASDIKQLLSEFGNILPLYYKMLVRLLVTFPHVTSASLHLISKIVRRFNLRRIVTRPPSKKI